MRAAAPLLAIGSLLVFVGAARATDGAAGFKVLVGLSLGCCAVAAGWARLPHLARTRGLLTALTAGAMLALPAFGPTMGTGLLCLVALLAGVLLEGRRGAAVVWVVLLIAYVLTATLELGQRALVLPPAIWVRIGVSTGVLLLGCMSLLLELRRLVREALEIEAQARVAELAATQRQRQMLVAATTSQRLEAVGQLAGGVAHDFNNALTVIRSGLELLQHPETEAERVEVLAECSRGVERAIASTRQLLSFARLREDEQGWCDVGPVLRSFQSSVGRALPANVRLVVASPPTTPPIGVPVGAFEQALLNLTLNARDALAPAGGTIELLCEPKADQTVTVSVRDTGPGMSEELRERVFEPFFTTKGEQGTGLGLAMVRATVERAGGRVELQSKVGQGTTVSMAFPPFAHQPLRVPRLTPIPPSSSGATVLVVDDEAALRSMMRRLLEREGHLVIEVATVRQATEVLQETAVSLVISDGVLEDGSLGDVLEQVRTLRPSARVLRCSAELTGPDELGVLRKPFDPGAFVSQVDRLLRAKN